jgi:hypothetical protein
VAVSSPTADNWTPILDIVVDDGYMMGQSFYKVLLSGPDC